jgi:hypothetical protein
MIKLEKFQGYTQGTYQEHGMKYEKNSVYPEHSWLRHYATSQTAAGSIPDEVTGFFNGPNPSSRTTALG